MLTYGPHGPGGGLVMVAVHSEIQVCVDCLLLLANGECDPDRQEETSANLAANWADFSLVVGGSHNERCEAEWAAAGHQPWEGRDHDCDCEELGFCQTSCDGCGSPLHGDRYAVTVFYREEGPQ